MFHWMFLGKIPVKMTNSSSSWARPFLSCLVNRIKITVSSNFGIHLRTLRLQHVLLGKNSYGSHTASTSMDCTTQVGCTSHHATHHEDYSRGVVKEQCRKLPQRINAVRAARDHLWKLRCPPWNTWSDLPRSKTSSHINVHKEKLGVHEEVCRNSQTPTEAMTNMVRTLKGDNHSRAWAKLSAQSRR